MIRSQYALGTADLDRLVAYLQVRAEGNPFFLCELLRELEAAGVLSRVAGSSDGPGETRWQVGELSRMGLPKMVRHVLERRLDRFAEKDRQLLAVAAVIGQEVPLALRSEVARIDQELLIDLVERVVAAHILVAARDGTTVRFDHALVREALYEGLLPPPRRMWHGRVAEALLRQPAADPDVLGFHFQRAGDERALEWLVRAAERYDRPFGCSKETILSPPNGLGCCSCWLSSVATALPSGVSLTLTTPNAWRAWRATRS